MERFRDKVAFVTGAGSGIGKATAIRFGAEEATVACLDVRLETAEATAAAVREAGAKAEAFAVDVSNPESVAAAVAAAVASVGAPDVLCNIAGIGRFAHSLEVSLEEWNRILGVNLTGTFLMSQACLPHLLERGGNIVNTASTAGLMAQPYSAAYCASKGGVVLLTKAMAYEYIDRGVRINAVAPGGVKTPILNDFGYPEGANMKLFARLMTPMGFSEPEEIAGLFAYLASHEARFITGTVVSIDGGMTA